jgi:hypothetical protein
LSAGLPFLKVSECAGTDRLPVTGVFSRPEYRFGFARRAGQSGAQWYRLDGDPAINERLGRIQTTTPDKPQQ